MESSLILLSANIRILVRRFSIYHAPFAALQGRKEKKSAFYIGGGLGGGSLMHAFAQGRRLIIPCRTKFFSLASRL